MCIAECLLQVHDLFVLLVHLPFQTVTFARTTSHLVQTLQEIDALALERV
jgi:hypothetical protein